MADTSKDGQISEASLATPEAGADGAPGTEDGTPPAADTHHSRPGGMRDYDADETTTPR